MDKPDIDLRNATYQRFVELGRAPTAADVAERIGRASAEVSEGWHRLHDAHALVLNSTGEIRMANPFSAVPTRYRVTAAGKQWYANCAWDAFGIGAALHVDSEIDTDCPDCNEPIRLIIREGQPDEDRLVFHVLVPAAGWWQDIGFT